jgi:UDP-N-acetylglucosamine 2-epimerase (non-hydrolysing)
MSIHILHVVGARPNFMKAASVLRALGSAGFRQSVVHTGQHYDANMSDVFFRELEIPEPDVNLAVGSGSHAQQTARIMTGFESVVLERKPDLVVVYGDVNSTVAAALVCAKLQIPVAHVEAGLRSNDRSMPEEINRLLTDQLSDLLFTPSADADRNLQREGIPVERIHLVGNVMIDTLVYLLPRALEKKRQDFPARYALVTLHRPSNVDDPEVLRRILSAILSVSNNKDADKNLAVIFPVHPRTRLRISEFGMATDGLHICDPLSYLDFLALQAGATVVLTDSGGIQEETTFLGVPCLTLRANTERPVTVEIGTNVLIGNDTERLRTELEKILNGKEKKGAIPPLWDGHAGERIARILLQYFEKQVNPAAAAS